MNISFKLGNKKDDKVEEIEEDEEEEEVEVKKASPDVRKQMIKLMLIIAGGMIFLLLLLFIISSFSTHYTYEQVEGIMKRAAESYFKDHPESLPQREGSGVEIDTSNLVAAGKMKSLSNYLDDACTGKVQVQKIDNDYIYVPYLNCGTSYSATEFYTKVTTDNPIVSSGYGLYVNNGNYVFRGEQVNNYVKLDKDIWRIVKITPNRNMVLVLDNSSISQAWDDRYNVEKAYVAGNNQYSLSRIQETLKRIYTSPQEKKGELILTDSDRAKMVSFDMCVGKRTSTDESKNNTEECKEKYPSQKVGLLTLSDYLYASIDPNCKNATSKACKNYNYLTIKLDWWLATPSTTNTSSVFVVSRLGNAEERDAATYAIVRPVITLNSNVFYKSGSGSESDPYELR